MAPTHSKQDDVNQTCYTTRGGFRLVLPPIGLCQTVPKNPDGKYSFEKIKFCTNLGDAYSITYKVPLEYFKEGTLEEWLLWEAKLTSRSVGRHHATNGPTQFAL